MPSDSKKFKNPSPPYLLSLLRGDSVTSSKNLRFLNSKYLKTLQIFDSSFNVGWLATVFLNGCESFFTSEFTPSLNKIENIYLIIYSMCRRLLHNYTTMT